VALKTGNVHATGHFRQGAEVFEAGR